MEVFGFNGLQYDEEKALNSLLDAFGSVFSLQDIASAYCEAGRNVALASEYLYEKQESTSSVASDASIASKQKWQPLSAACSASNGEAKNDKSCSNSPRNYCQANGDLKAPKQKWKPVSGGTISSMLGKGYMKSVPLANGSYSGSKPLKVDLKELPMSSLWGEEPKSNLVKEDGLHKDMEDFLFRMLGKGFQLDRDMIRDVLDSCGYDMQKSMEKLLDRSALNLDNENKFLGESSKKTNGIYLKADEPSQEKNGVLKANGGEFTRQGEDRNDAQQAVLEALFNGRKRDDEPIRRVRSKRRPLALGELVEGPLIDSTAEKKVDRVHSLEVEDKRDDEDEGDFQSLQRAVKEYRVTMKEYYKAAIDAFAKGDIDQANKLLEQGQFFREKARQADEESNQKIFETSNKDAEDEMLLDLHDHGAKEAIRLLKCHLSSLAGIPSFKYLKVILDSNEEDTSKGTRRRLVMKLLEKESISWSEGETCGVVLIRLDKINPKRLSFAKKIACK